ncbi:Lysine-specific demethylase 2B-like protein [Leptotrombidium deliense]|uniref:Lysine-specific demethylase 2B-like protein n=1 Tax=Leptotrombidium deliense TaxID=299467 RepID=A0A443SD97_9ACAR|nr:Lysine-specific demethylase 2B-like protein [Leptotrombidium deliense]
MRFSGVTNHSSQVYSLKKSLTPKRSSSTQSNKHDAVENSTSKKIIVDEGGDRLVTERLKGFQLAFDEDTDNDTDENYESRESAKSNMFNSRYSSSPSSSSDEYDSSENNVKKVRLSNTVCDNSNRQCLKPKFVVRPAPLEEDVSDSEDDTDKKLRENDESDDDHEKQKSMNKYFKKLKKTKVENLCLERDVMLPVLPYLCRKDLINCMLVCKVWNGWCLDPKLWKNLDLTRQKITSNSLIGLVRRQPMELNLSWSSISKRQLSWLIARLPQLQSLSLAGCASSILNALCTCNCPLLKMLDLSWVDSLCDNIVRELLSAPLDSRPGVLETKTRLRHLTEIRLSGSAVSDVSIRLMSHHLPQLAVVDLSNCQKVSDMGIAVLGAAKSSKLTTLKLSSCGNISDTSLDALKRCQHLKHLDLRDCNQVSVGACHKFILTINTKTRLTMKIPKLLESKCN